MSAKNALPEFSEYIDEAIFDYVAKYEVNIRENDIEEHEVMIGKDGVKILQITRGLGLDRQHIWEKPKVSEILAHSIDHYINENGILLRRDLEKSASEYLKETGVNEFHISKYLLDKNQNPYMHNLLYKGGIKDDRIIDVLPRRDNLGNIGNNKARCFYKDRSMAVLEILMNYVDIGNYISFQRSLSESRKYGDKVQGQSS